MSKYTNEHMQKIVDHSDLYARGKYKERIRIMFTQDDHFLGLGEESGAEYKVYYEEIDMNKATFYRLVAVDPKSAL